MPRFVIFKICTCSCGKARCSGAKQVTSVWGPFPYIEQAEFQIAITKHLLGENEELSILELKQSAQMEQDLAPSGGKC